jgi:transposase
MFTWYWLADLCAKHHIRFVLGHALYMKAIHGGKTKNDKIDSEKIAMLLRGGMLPEAYAYPHKMRATRDLLRRRMYLMHHRAEALAHIVNTASQYNLPPMTKKLTYAANRQQVAELFPAGSVRLNVESDLALIDHFDEQLRRLELELSRSAKVDNARDYYLLRSIPGVGKILALVMLYEIHDVRRFSKAGRFLSYARLVKCAHESAGKRLGAGGKKIGNAHLKWAFSEATLLLMRQLPAAKEYVAALANKHGKGKALSILSARLGRTVYLMLKRQQPFDAERFLKT